MSLISKLLEKLSRLEKAKEKPDQLQEGKTYPIDKKTDIRIDAPAHGVGQKHAHILRQGTPERVINKDGTSSHKTGPFMVSDNEREFLVKKGFTVPKDSLVESLDPKAKAVLLEERSKT